MITYLSFQMRMRPLTIGISSERISIAEYIEGFEQVLRTIGWDEEKLLSEINKHW